MTSKVQPGSIVLFHNAALHTPEALPGIIEALLQEGYSFLPISQLLLTCDYTIDHTGPPMPGGEHLMTRFPYMKGSEALPSALSGC